MTELLNLKVEANIDALEDIERNANYTVNVDTASLRSYIAKTQQTIAETDKGQHYSEKLRKNLAAAQRLLAMVHEADGSNATAHLRERWEQADTGRLYGQGYSLQCMTQEVRHAALGVCHKYDFKACAFALMAGLAHSIDPTLKLGATLDYITNRAKIRERIATQTGISVALVKVIFTALSQNGPGMADQVIRDISDSMTYDKTYNGVSYKGRKIVNGVDYAFLGYKPYYALVILGMGQNFRLPFPLDYYGTPIDSIPMMKGVNNYDQVACVISLSSGNISDAWISYGQGRFNFPLFFGCTGVQTAQYYPFYGSGQLSGLMGGMLGAAQYESYSDNPGRAMEAMKVQLPAHIVIILFILMGNIGFFASRSKRKLGEVN